MNDRTIGQELTRFASAASFTEEPPGTRIGGHYEVRALIGRGGMGAVYRCQDLRLERPVAVKRIAMQGPGGDAALARFRREAQAIASLNHRNIAIVHEFSEDAIGPYLVMELLAGADLGAFVAANGAMPVADVIEAAQQVGAALSYAHRRGVVHRDIKPSNLFRLKDRTIKVLDFGLARVGSDSQLSVAGLGLGTIDYVSPEQRVDASRVDHRSDLFSLGATLYYLATGRAPRLVRERDIPEELRSVVLSLMEDQPEDRPFSVEEALAPLNRERASSVRPSSGTLQRMVEEGACPACGTANTADARFCRDCGAGLFESCPACHTEARVGGKYCAKCGGPMHAGQPAQPSARTIEPATPPPVRVAPPPEQSVDVASHPDERHVLSLATRRIVLFAALLHAAAILSVIDVGFVAHALLTELALPSSAFNHATLAFTIAVSLFALPSILIANRFGARNSIAAMTIGCGLVSTGTMFVRGPVGLAAVRFLLGAVEAGLLPALILYVSSWFPPQRRARPMAFVLAGGLAAGFIAAPLANALLSSVASPGMADWEALFLIEALPAVILGAISFRRLPKGPQDAAWLSGPERRWLQDRLAEDGAIESLGRPASVRQLLRAKQVWVFCALYFLLTAGMEIGSDLRGEAVFFASSWSEMASYAVALAGLISIGLLAERRIEVRWLVLAPAALAVLGAVIFALSNWRLSVGAYLILLGIWGAQGPFWAMTSSLAARSAASVAVALVYSVGNLAYLFVIPTLAAFGFKAGMLLMAGALALLVATVALVVPRAGVRPVLTGNG